MCLGTGRLLSAINDRTKPEKGCLVVLDPEKLIPVHASNCGIGFILLREEQEEELTEEHWQFGNVFSFCGFGVSIGMSKSLSNTGADWVEGCRLSCSNGYVGSKACLTVSSFVACSVMGLESCFAELGMVVVGSGHG